MIVEIISMTKLLVSETKYPLTPEFYKLWIKIVKKKRTDCPLNLLATKKGSTYRECVKRKFDYNKRSLYWKRIKYELKYNKVDRKWFIKQLKYIKKNYAFLL